MEGFTIPTSETEWPEESYFADPKDIEDVDGVLEVVASRIEKRPENLYDRRNFGILLSLVKRRSKLRADNRTRILTALRVASSCLAAGFAKNLQHWQSLPECKDLERQCVTTVKAYAFLLTRMILGEDEVLKGSGDDSHSQPMMAPTKRRGKKQQNEEAALLAHQGKVSIWNIEREREEILSAVVSLVEMPFSAIWLPDSNFFNLFTHLAFSLIETPLNAKSASLRSSCMAILRPIVVTYKAQSDLILRFIHKLRTNDTIVSSLLDLVTSMKHDPAVLPFLSELYRELAKVPIRDVSSNATLAKNIASVVSDTCAQFPKLVLPSVSLIVELLGHEAYTVRSGVIQGIGVLIIEGFKQTRPENSDEKNDTEAEKDGEISKKSKRGKKKTKQKTKKTKSKNTGEDGDEDEEDSDESDEDDAREDELSDDDADIEKNVAPPVHQTLEALLDILTERLLDTSSYTRSKVVNTWASLARARAIPLSRYLTATEGALKRLSDKAANVRKGAIELLHDLIENNPYGPNLSLPVWEQRLQEIRDVLASKGIVSNSLAPTPAKNPKASSKKRKGKSKQSKSSKYADKEQEEDEVEGEENENEKMDETEGENNEKEDENNEKGDENNEKGDENNESNDSEEGEDHNGSENEMKVDEGGAKALEAELVGNQKIEEDDLVDIEKRAKEHAVAAIRFIGMVHKALPIVTTLLGSKNIGDVTEAIKLLAKAHTFKTEEAFEGIRTVLMLVCSKEAGIKEAAVQAYVDLYLTPKVAVAARDMPVFISRNLISLTHKASLGQLTSLEELLKDLAAAGRISSAILPVLWSYFEYKADHRCGALIILSMLSQTFPNALEKLVPHLFKLGLGTEIVDNPELAKWTFIAIQKIRKNQKRNGKFVGTADHDHDEDDNENFDDYNDDDENNANSKKSNQKTSKKGSTALKKSAILSKGSSSNRETSLSPSQPPFDHASIVSICNFLTLTGNASPKHSNKSSIPAIETSAWYPAAEQAVNAIFYLTDAPSTILSEVLKKLAIQLQRAHAYASDSATMADSGANMNETQIGGSSTSSVSSIVGRIMFILGHIAIKQLVFIEEVTRERQLAKSKAKQAATSKTTTTKKKKTKSEKKKSSKREEEEEYEEEKEGESGEEGGRDEEEPEAIELELGAVGAEAAGETHDEERARLSAQHAMVTKRVIGQFLPLVEAICKNEKVRATDAMLYGVAVHTLSKCMLVSQESCATHLELMKEVARDEKTEPKIRANLVILMGDLAMRFPNLFEAHAGALYERLADKDESVRKAALVVVSHLVLTNMVKPRGHMSDIAVCLEDESTSIVDAARLFFKELAAKDNALMLLLPDTISSLYRKNLHFDTAKSILQFLLSFVDLQRDLVSLVDKLCQQFPTSPEKRSWRYLAYCMSMLNHTDASIERLASHFKLYKDALHDETTNGFFLQAVRARRSKTGSSASGSGAGGSSSSANASSKDGGASSGAGGSNGAGAGSGNGSHGGAPQGSAPSSEGGVSPEALEEKIIAIAEGTYVDGLDAEEPSGKRAGGKRGGKKATAAKTKKRRAASDDFEDNSDVDDDMDVDDDKPTTSAAASRKKVAPAPKRTSARPKRAPRKRYADSDSDVELLEEDSD